MKFSAFCIALCVALVASEKARYDNYRVYEISVEDEQQLELMKHIESYPDGVRTFCFRTLNFPDCGLSVSILGVWRRSWVNG